MTMDSEEVKSKVRLPALALLAVGTLDALLAIVIIVSGFFTGTFRLGPPEGVVGIVSFATSAFIIVGACRMMRTRGLVMAYVASVLAMIPCLSTCFLIGLPVGIWSLVVLLSQDVRSAFR
jgi:hypothetical protein